MAKLGAERRDLRDAGSVASKGERDMGAKQAFAAQSLHRLAREPSGGVHVAGVGGGNFRHAAHARAEILGRGRGVHVHHAAFCSAQISSIAVLIAAIEEKVFRFNRFSGNSMSN